MSKSNIALALGKASQAKASLIKSLDALWASIPAGDKAIRAGQRIVLVAGKTMSIEDYAASLKAFKPRGKNPVKAGTQKSAGQVSISLPEQLDHIVKQNAGNPAAYFLTADGGILSMKTVQEELPLILDSMNRYHSEGVKNTETEQWAVVGFGINDSDPDMSDDHTGEMIPVTANKVKADAADAIKPAEDPKAIPDPKEKQADPRRDRGDKEDDHYAQLEPGKRPAVVVLKKPGTDGTIYEARTVSTEQLNKPDADFALAQWCETEAEAKKVAKALEQGRADKTLLPDTWPTHKSPQALSEDEIKKLHTSKDKLDKIRRVDVTAGKVKAGGIRKGGDHPDAFDFDWTETPQAFTFKVNDAMKESLLEQVQQGRSQSALYDLLEGIIANSDIDWIQPEEIGALTDAPIFGHVDRDDQGKVVNVGHVWWYPDYMVSDPIEELATKGTVTFVGAPENAKVAATKVKAMGRMITDAIAQAFLKGQRRRIANTSTDGQTIWLHNNAIARKAADGSVEITLAGWPTATTRERLNGLLNAMGINKRVSQRGGEQMLDGKPWDGEWISVGPMVDMGDQPGTTGPEVISSRLHFMAAVLELWKTPRDYAGPDFPDYYLGLARHRDSETLENANFDSMLEKLGGEHTSPEFAKTHPDTEEVMVTRASHWAVGWAEQILVHKDSPLVPELESMLNSLEDYPVLDEDKLTEMESAKMADDWETYGQAEVLNALSKVEGMGEYDTWEKLPPDLAQSLQEAWEDSWSSSDGGGLTQAEIASKAEAWVKAGPTRERKALEEAGQQTLPGMEARKKALISSLHLIIAMNKVKAEPDPAPATGGATSPVIAAVEEYLALFDKYNNTGATDSEVSGPGWVVLKRAALDQPWDPKEVDRWGFYESEMTPEIYQEFKDAAVKVYKIVNEQATPRDIRWLKDNSHYQVDWSMAPGSLKPKGGALPRRPFVQGAGKKKGKFDPQNPWDSKGRAPHELGYSGPDPDDVDPEPEDEDRGPDPEMDIIIGDDGLSAYYAGKEIASVTRDEADEDEDALEKAVAAWMDQHGFFPDVWSISDHGNPSIVTERFFKFTKQSKGKKVKAAMVGEEGIVRWTNGGRQYTAKAKVVTANPKSTVVELLDPAGDDPEKTGYTTGRKIKVPNPGTKYNGFFTQEEGDRLNKETEAKREARRAEVFRKLTPEEAEARYAKIKDIVNNQGHGKVDGFLMDGSTAQAIVNVVNHLESKGLTEKRLQYISLSVPGMADFAWKVNTFKSAKVKADEIGEAVNRADRLLREAKPKKKAKKPECPACGETEDYLWDEVAGDPSSFEFECQHCGEIWRTKKSDVNLLAMKLTAADVLQGDIVTFNDATSGDEAEGRVLKQVGTTMAGKPVYKVQVLKKGYEVRLSEDDIITVRRPHVTAAYGDHPTNCQRCGAEIHQFDQAKHKSGMMLCPKCRKDDKGTDAWMKEQGEAASKSRKQRESMMGAKALKADRPEPRIYRKVNKDGQEGMSGEFSEDGGKTWYAFTAWVPLAKVHLAWGTAPAEVAQEIINLSEYPEMAEEGDWSAFRDSSDEQIREMEKVADRWRGNKPWPWDLPQAQMNAAKQVVLASDLDMARELMEMLESMGFETASRFGEGSEALPKEEDDAVKADGVYKVEWTIAARFVPKFEKLAKRLDLEMVQGGDGGVDLNEDEGEEMWTFTGSKDALQKFIQEVTGEPESKADIMKASAPYTAQPMKKGPKFDKSTRFLPREGLYPGGEMPKVKPGEQRDEPPIPKPKRVEGGALRRRPFPRG